MSSQVRASPVCGQNGDYSRIDKKDDQNGDNTCMNMFYKNIQSRIGLITSQGDSQANIQI